jgi:uncharacterized protein
MKYTDKEFLSFIQKSIPSLSALYLFGSVASEQNSTSSDIDFAFLADETIATLHIWELTQVIAQKLNCDVDPVDLSRTSEVFSFEIISKGKRLWAKDSKAIEYFEDKVYMLYVDLNDNRIEILKDIQKRGTVY